MIFLIGQHGSGKNTLANIFLNRYKLLHIDISRLLKEDRIRNSPEMNTPEWVNYVVSNYGLGYFANVVSENTIKMAEEAHNQSRDYDEIMFTGCRTPAILYPTREVVASIQNIFPNKLQRLRVIRLNAPREILVSRILHRDIGTSLQVVKQMLDGDMEHGLGILFERADFVLENNKSINNLKQTAFDLAENVFNLRPMCIYGEAKTTRVSKER